MDKAKIIVELGTYPIAQADKGAAYLHSIHEGLSEEQQGEFNEWLEKIFDDEPHIRHSVKYFLQELHFTKENILLWIEQAQMKVEGAAQTEIESIKRDLELKPDKQQRAEYIKQQHDYWFKELKSKGGFMYDATKDIEIIAERIAFLYNRTKQLYQCSMESFALPSQKVIHVVSPALKAKRIIELLNDIDKSTVCSVIPSALLSDIYKTFNKKYLGYDSEKEFINCIHNDKPLEYRIEGVITNFQYLFNMILIKLQEAGFEINKQAVYRKIFNLKKGKNRTTHNGKVKEVDVFLTSFNAKKYT